MSLVMRKQTFCICENKGADQLCSNCTADQPCAVTAQLISPFVVATQIVQSLFFLNPKFQASRLLLWLYRLVCVGPCRILKLLVFSCEGSLIIRHKICKRNTETLCLLDDPFTGKKPVTLPKICIVLHVSIVTSVSFLPGLWMGF